MRAALTIPLVAVFCLAGAAFALVSSVVVYLGDPDSVLHSTRDSRLREQLVDVTSDLIHEQIAADPTLVSTPREQIHPLVDDVISEGWFADSLRRTHTTLVAAITQAGRSRSTLVDLSDTKQALRRSLTDLAARARSSCAAVLGPATCGASGEMASRVARFERRGLAAIDLIGDDFDVVEELGMGQEIRVEDLQGGYDTLDSVRWLSLAVWVFALGLVIAINIRPLQRLLIWLGVCALTFAILFVVGGQIVTGQVVDRLHEVAAAERARQGELTHAGERTADAVQGTVEQMVVDSTGAGTVIAGLIGVGGVALVGVGVVVGRRRSSVRSA